MVRNFAKYKLVQPVYMTSNLPIRNVKQTALDRLEELKKGFEHLQSSREVEEAIARDKDRNEFLYEIFDVVINTIKGLENKKVITRLYEFFNNIGVLKFYCSFGIGSTRKDINLEKDRIQFLCDTLTKLQDDEEKSLDILKLVSDYNGGINDLKTTESYMNAIKYVAYCGGSYEEILYVIGYSFRIELLFGSLWPSSDNSTGMLDKKVNKYINRELAIKCLDIDGNKVDMSSQKKKGLKHNKISD